MVLADKSDAGKKSRASSPNNGQRSESSSDEREGGGGMRVGRDYQAAVPPLIPVLGINVVKLGVVLTKLVIDRKSEQYADRALLVWSPNNDIPEAKLEEYITVSKEKYGYNTEQALGMLFWHKHDLEKAVTDLSNFTPFPDEWTVEDKVLFEQAFQFHGKSFHRIRQMLPDKTIAALVRYYYSWKKIRVRSSLMDKQIRRIAQKGLDEVLGEEGSEAARSPRSESVDAKAETKDGEVRSACTNCGISCLSLQSTNKGNLCGTCAQHFKKTGLLRPTLGPIRPKDKVNAHSLHSSINRHKRGPPKGMYLEHDALLTIATGDQGQGEAILKDMDGEVVALKRMVQSNKQLISALKRRTTQGLWAGLGPNVPVPKLETTPKINARWTNEELLLAVQGVRKFGKDLKAIAEVLGTKTEAHVRSFFVTYQKRYNLKAVLAEYYAETGMPMPPVTEDEKMEIDLGSSGSEASTPIATTPGRVSPIAPSAVPVPPQPLVTPIKLNPNSKLTSTASPSAQTQAVK